jgi:hypothetical protein
MYCSKTREGNKYYNISVVSLITLRTGQCLFKLDTNGKDAATALVMSAREEIMVLPTRMKLLRSVALN